MKTSGPVTPRGPSTAAILINLASISTAWCASPTPPTLRLAEVVVVARRANPDIVAANARARVAAAIPAKASAWDDPVLSWEAWNIPQSGSIDQADNNIFRLSQKIPFPGKRRLAGEMARHEADAATHGAEAVELDVVAAATRAYWALWEAHQRVGIYLRERELVQHVARIAEQRYATGEVSQADVLRAQVEVTHAINRVTTGRLGIESARAELNTVLDRLPEEPLGVPEDITPRPIPTASKELVALALARRPELAAQTAAVTREETGLGLAHRAYYPDFEVSVGRFVNASGPNGFGAMASMTIPLAFRTKYDAGVGEATARVAVAEADRRRLENLIRRDVQQAFARLRTARLQHELLVTTHLPQAEQALRVSEGAYQAGRIDFLALIDTVRAIETAHLEHIEAVGAEEIAVADLERAIGGPLPGDDARSEGAEETVHDD